MARLKYAGPFVFPPFFPGPHGNNAARPHRRLTATTIDLADAKVSNSPISGVLHHRKAPQPNPNERLYHVG